MINYLIGFSGLFFLASILLPLSLIKTSNSKISNLSLFFILIGCFLTLIFSVDLIWKDKIFFYPYVLSGIPINLYIDRLSAFFLILISLVSFSVVLYAFGYLKHVNPKKRNFLTALMAIFILAMGLVVSTKNLFAFLIFWELMSLSSFLLVMFEYQKKETKKAGIFYFVMTQLSTVFLLFAFVLIYKFTGNLDITSLKNLPNMIILIIYAALFIGFSIKAGVIPFHKWLPYAHPASPSLISALMSGIMIKIAIYGLIRFILILPSMQLFWGLIILILGSFSAVLGIIYALKEHDLKRLLAYSSIENIGIIFICVGLYLIFLNYGFKEIALIALIAGLFHTLNHALFKSLLFLNAGAIINATNTRDIEKMGGLIKTIPLTAILFLIGAISISALPPLNGFISELLIFQVFFKSSLIPIPLVKLILCVSLCILALTSALSLACFTKVFGLVFLALPRSIEAQNTKEAPLAMILGQSILAFFCVFLGVFAFQIFTLVGEILKLKFNLPNMFIITLVFLVISGLVVAFVWLFASKKVRKTETWGCGLNSQNAQMEYTASGFSEPIVTIFKSIYQTKKINQRNFFDKEQTVFKDGEAKIILIKFFEEYLYFPILKLVLLISKLIDNLQKDQDLDTYLFYSFITIILLILIAGIFL